jgi:hypothetical protein
MRDLLTTLSNWLLGSDTDQPPTEHTVIHNQITIIDLTPRSRLPVPEALTPQPRHFWQIVETLALQRPRFWEVIGSNPENYWRSEAHSLLAPTPLHNMQTELYTFFSALRAAHRPIAEAANAAIHASAAAQLAADAANNAAEAIRSNAPAA